MPRHGHAQLVGEQRLVGHQVNDDVVDGPAGELGRVDRSGPVVDRQVAQEQDGSRQLDAVDVDRRRAGDHRSRLPAAPCLGEHPGAQLGSRRDLVHDRSGELAGREAQVLLPTQGVGTGVEVGGDPGGVLGIVCVDRVGGQIVRRDRSPWRFVVHAHRSLSTLISEPRTSAMRPNARRSRDLAVPSGMFSTSAT